MQSALRVASQEVTNTKTEEEADEWLDDIKQSACVTNRQECGVLGANEAIAGGPPGGG
jgi:hypothetical protein